jgi:parallel beta-helix repeat protein
MKSTLRFTTSIVLSALSIFAIVTQAEAHGKRPKYDDHSGRQYLHSCIFNHAPKPHAPSNAQLPLVTVACGDVITQSIRVANNLNCPDVDGFALSVKGDNIKIDGNGHSINAENAIAGVYVEGSGNTVTNFKINDTRFGIYAYNASGLTVTKNDVSDNETGIWIYADQPMASTIKVTNNKATGNDEFGVHFAQDGAGSIVSPTVSNNNFSKSGDYAMYLNVTRFDLDFTDNNDLQASLNGLYLKNGTFSIKGVTLSGEKIVRAAIFVDSAEYIEVNALDVSTVLNQDPMQQHIGLDLYRVKKFKIAGLLAYNNDVGLKLETEQGAQPSGSIKCSYFLNNLVAGIMVSSYDSTPYGNLDLDNNFFKVASGATKILTSDGTVWAML